MIDEILYHVYESGGENATYIRSDHVGKPLSPAQALTAIYEIGLGVIGADAPEVENKPGQKALYWRIKDRNELRASQRKAWAKACGVADV